MYTSNFISICIYSIQVLKVKRTHTNLKTHNITSYGLFLVFIFVLIHYEFK